MSDTLVRKIPTPQIDAQSRPFWDAAKEGVLLLKSCVSCGKTHWYPRKHCPFCASSNTQWTQASGRGTVYTYSIMRRAKPAYVVAYVRLEEGPTVLTNLVDVDFERIKVGQAVHVLFLESEDGVHVPVFKPVITQEAANHAE